MPTILTDTKRYLRQLVSQGSNEPVSQGLDGRPTVARPHWFTRFKASGFARVFRHDEDATQAMDVYRMRKQGFAEQFDRRVASAYGLEAQQDAHDALMRKKPLAARVRLNGNGPAGAAPRREYTAAEADAYRRLAKAKRDEILSDNEARIAEAMDWRAGGALHDAYASRVGVDALKELTPDDLAIAEAALRKRLAPRWARAERITFADLVRECAQLVGDEDELDSFHDWAVAAAFGPLCEPDGEVPAGAKAWVTRYLDESAGRNPNLAPLDMLKLARQATALWDALRNLPGIDPDRFDEKLASRAKDPSRSPATMLERLRSDTILQLEQSMAATVGPIASQLAELRSMRKPAQGLMALGKLLDRAVDNGFAKRRLHAAEHGHDAVYRKLLLEVAVKGFMDKDGEQVFNAALAESGAAVAAIRAEVLAAVARDDTLMPEANSANLHALLSRGTDLSQANAVLGRGDYGLAAKGQPYTTAFLGATLRWRIATHPQAADRMLTSREIRQFVREIEAQHLQLVRRAGQTREASEALVESMAQDAVAQSFANDPLLSLRDALMDEPLNALFERSADTLQAAAAPAVMGDAVCSSIVDDVGAWVHAHASASIDGLLEKAQRELKESARAHARVLEAIRQDKSLDEGVRGLFLELGTVQRLDRRIVDAIIGASQAIARLQREPVASAHDVARVRAQMRSVVDHALDALAGPSSRRALSVQTCARVEETIWRLASSMPTGGGLAPVAAARAVSPVIAAPDDESWDDGSGDVAEEAPEDEVPEYLPLPDVASPEASEEDASEVDSRDKPEEDVEPGAAHPAVVAQHTYAASLETVYRAALDQVAVQMAAAPDTWKQQIPFEGDDQTEEDRQLVVAELERRIQALAASRLIATAIKFESWGPQSSGDPTTWKHYTSTLGADNAREFVRNAIEGPDGVLAAYRGAVSASNQPSLRGMPNRFAAPQALVDQAAAELDGHVGVNRATGVQLEWQPKRPAASASPGIAMAATAVTRGNAPAKAPRKVVAPSLVERARNAGIRAAVNARTAAVRSTVTRHGGKVSFAFSQNESAFTDVLDRDSLTAGGVCDALCWHWLAAQARSVATFSQMHPGGRFTSETMASVLALQAEGLEKDASQTYGGMGWLLQSNPPGDQLVIQGSSRTGEMQPASELDAMLDNLLGDDPTEHSRFGRIMLDGKRMGMELAHTVTVAIRPPNGDITYFDPNFGEFTFPNRKAFRAWFDEYLVASDYAKSFSAQESWTLVPA